MTAMPHEAASQGTEEPTCGRAPTKIAFPYKDDSPGAIEIMHGLARRRALRAIGWAHLNQLAPPWSIGENERYAGSCLAGGDKYFKSVGGPSVAVNSLLFVGLGEAW